MSRSDPAFVHRIRVRYAEIDGQGVVFNAHWLTYFDDSCTRFMSSLGFGPGFWTKELDVMLVKAIIEWTGPVGFDEWVDIEVAPSRIGTKSFDLSYRASVDRRDACVRIRAARVEPCRRPRDGRHLAGGSRGRPRERVPAVRLPG